MPVEKSYQRKASSATDKTPLLVRDNNLYFNCTCDTMTHFSWCRCPVKLAERKLLFDLLAVLFGVAAWIAVNGMFMQLPLLVQTQPEGWNLPSFLSVIIQIGNIGPISYSILQKLHPTKIKDSIVIYLILICGCVALLLMAFFYKETTWVHDGYHSVALFVLAFFIALVGCTSSVLFMPYMSNFRDIYLISYFVGEGLSGLLPSVVALIQGVGGNPTCVEETDPTTNSTVWNPVTPDPLFSTQAFFIFLFVTLSISTFAFSLMNNLQYCESERVKPLYAPRRHHDSSSSGDRSPSSPGDDDLQLKRSYDRKDSERSASFQNDTVILLPSSCCSIYLLIIASWVCFMGNGVFPSIQSFSCLPYGNVAYHLSVTLASMSNPLACFVAFFIPKVSIKTITFLTVLSTGVAGYIATTAFTSPTPPLVNSVAGEALVVSSWIVFTGLVTFVKVSIASIFRQVSGRALFWCGASQQMGSAVGAVIIFLLVNRTQLFQSYYPCEGL